MGKNGIEFCGIEESVFELLKKQLAWLAFDLKKGEMTK